MCKESDPCYGCERRVATTEYNCHSHCKEYAEYKQRLMDKSKAKREKRIEEGIVNDYVANAAMRSSRKKHKQNAWNK